MPRVQRRDLYVRLHDTIKTVTVQKVSVPMCMSALAERNIALEDD